jgi:hypothetical protein
MAESARRSNAGRTPLVASAFINGSTRSTRTSIPFTRVLNQLNKKFRTDGIDPQECDLDVPMPPLHRWPFDSERFANCFHRRAIIDDNLLPVMLNAALRRL